MLGQQPTTSQIDREPTRRNPDSRRARTMSVQWADELSYPLRREQVAMSPTIARGA